MKLVPLEDYMILELDESMKSALDIPGAEAAKAREDSAVFVVKDIGPGYTDNVTGKLVVPEVKIGDKILLTGFSLAVLSYQRKKFPIARARDVAVIIREEEVK